MNIWQRLLRNAVHVGNTLVITVFFFGSALNCNGERKPTESIDFTKPMFSSLTADQKQLLLDYHKNYSRLVDYYNNCTMKLRQDSYSIFRPSDTEGTPPPPGRKLDDEPKGITRYVYYGNGGNRFRLDRTKCDPADPSSILNSYTGIITPSDSYILQAEADNFSVKEHRGMKESDLHRLRSYVFVNAPYAYAGHPLQYMLFQNVLHEPAPGRPPPCGPLGAGLG